MSPLSVLLRWRTICKIFIFSTTICTVYIITIDLMSVSSIYTQQITSIKSLPFCFSNGSTEHMEEGEWLPMEGLVDHHYHQRRELDKFIRTAMDWAPILHRSDLRCGKNFPIPGYRLLAQCNPTGHYPCCNQNTGMCSNGPLNCKCTNCTDFKMMISAELATWRPKKCKLKNFRWQDSCALLQKNGISLNFIGDSLIRQMHTMLLLHLTNDYETGAIPKNASEQSRQKCSGILQLTRKECSIDVCAKAVDELNNGSLCTGFSTRNIRIDQVQDYHKTLIPEVEKKITSLLNRKNAWIIGGVGLHYQLDFDLLKREYLNKLVELLNKSHNGWPKLLWIENHGYSGFIRQRSGPRMEVLKNFNQIIAHYLEEHNIPIIKTFELSKSVRSYDGRHHGIGLNELKAKLLLNYLKEFYK